MKGINFVAIDFETATSTAACQIGIVVVRQGKIVGEFSHLIQPPGNKYNPYTITVHHITPELTADAPSFSELWPTIKPYLERQFIVSHNISFDMSILEKELERNDIPQIKILGKNCTCELTNGMKLEEACELYGIDLENHHDGLADARACAQIFIKYLMTDYEPIIKEKKKPKKEAKKTPDTMSVQIRLDGHYEDEDEKKTKKKHATANFEDFIGHGKIRHDLLIPDLEHADKDSPLFGKKVVITGVFPIERGRLAEIIKKMGADINTSITCKTNVVLIGEDPGPAKLKKISTLLAKGEEISTYNIDQTLALIEKYK